MHAWRVAVFGDINNYPIILAEGLRALGHDVTLFVNRPEAIHRPENRDRALAEGYPSWIVDVSHLTEHDYAIKSPAFLDVVTALRRGGYDLFVLNDLGICLSEYLFAPQVAFVTGSDLTYYADYRSLELRGNASEARYRRSADGLWTLRRFADLVSRQRHGFLRADLVACAPPGVMPDADALLDGMGVEDRRRRPVLMSDVERLAPAEWPANDRLTVLCGARIQWRQTADGAYASTDLKGADVLIRGFALYRDGGGTGELRLVRKGPDIDAAKALIADLGITDHVVWLDQMSLDGYRAEVVKANIVCDSLGTGGTGMVTRDGLAQGRPILANLRNAEMVRTLPEPMPGLQASTPAEVAERLTWAERSPAELRALGARSRRFAEEVIGPRRAAEDMLTALDSLLAEETA